MENKIEIEARYLPEEEIRTNQKPYEDYYSCLNDTFELSKTNSFCDVGCANGPLLSILKKEHENMDLLGLEYFDWQKSAAHPEIQKLISIQDLRDDIGDKYKKYEIVNCTETGEHIDPDYCDIFLNNLKKLTTKYLIISWANSGGVNDRVNDKNLQHLNPLPIEKVRQMVSDYGFEFDERLTNLFINSSLNKNEFYFWWRNSLSIFKVKQ